MKILIVDDNEKMRKTVIQNIKQNNDFVFECENGEQAINDYAQYHPDIVLMDIKMKNVNGIEATKSIVNNFPAAKIIIFTSYDTHVFKKAAMEAGAVMLLPKKNLYNLREEIQKYL